MNIKFYSTDVLEQWKQIKTNWIIQLTTKFVLLLIVTSLIIILLRWSYLPPAIPLWYSKAWGYPHVRGCGDGRSSGQ